MARKGFWTRNVERALIRNIIQHPERYYVNVHNADFPVGAVRGQLSKQMRTRACRPQPAPVRP